LIIFNPASPVHTARPTQFQVRAVTPAARRVCPEALFAQKTGSERCSLCPAGKHQGSEGATACKSCTPGHHLKKGASAPLPCDKGSFSNATNLTSAETVPRPIQASSDRRLAPSRLHAAQAPIQLIEAKPAARPAPPASTSQKRAKRHASSAGRAQVSKGGCHGVHQVHFRPSTVLPYGSCSPNRAS
jgi:hypothetical protein